MERCTDSQDIITIMFIMASNTIQPINQTFHTSWILQESKTSILCLLIAEFLFFPQCILLVSFCCLSNYVVVSKLFGSGQVWNFVIFHTMFTPNLAKSLKMLMLSSDSQQNTEMHHPQFYVQTQQQQFYTGAGLLLQKQHQSIVFVWVILAAGDPLLPHSFTLSLIIFHCMLWKFPPNDKILDKSRLKVFAGDSLDIAELIIRVFDRVRNCGIWRNFLLIPQCLLRSNLSQSLKFGIV